MTTVLILAGGRGSRIGADKAAQMLGGQPLLQWVVSAAEQVASEIVVAGAPGQALPDLRAHVPVRICYDDDADLGPLSGIAAGLTCTTDQEVLVVPCDAPLLRPALMRGMLAARRDEDVLVPEVAGRLQTAFGVWSTRSLSVVRAALKSNDRSLHGVLRRLQTRVMAEDELHAFDPDLLSFLNINTRDDLIAMEARIAAIGSGTAAFDESA